MAFVPRRRASMNGVISQRQAFRALNTVVIPLVKRGVLAPLPLPVATGFVVLETTGRVSGKRRDVPLLATRIGPAVVVSTVRSSSHWVANLAAGGPAAVWLDGRRVVAQRRIVRGPLNVAVLRLR
jgi:hypothetical protein